MHLPEDSVPYWDLDVEQTKNEPRDASALAIVTHALLLLSELSEYGQHAKVWLEALVENCLVPVDRSGLIQHVCFHRPEGTDVDCSCMFADFYFLLSLAIATGRLQNIYRF